MWVIQQVGNAFFDKVKDHTFKTNQKREEKKTTTWKYEWDGERTALTMYAFENPYDGERTDKTIGTARLWLLVIL